MKKTVKTWGSLILFIGALWGVVEATLGYTLQFFPPLVSGFIMFPIAASLLMYAYLKSDSRRVLLLIGFVAISIKAINYAFPMMHWRTTNPMVAMFFETLMVLAIARVVVRKPVQVKVLAFAGASVGWRLLYMAYMGVQFITTGFLHQSLQSPVAFVSFVLVQGLLGAALAVGLYTATVTIEKRSIKRFAIHPIAALSMLMLAIITTVLL